MLYLYGLKIPPDKWKKCSGNVKTRWKIEKEVFAGLSHEIVTYKKATKNTKKWDWVYAKNESFLSETTLILAEFFLRIFFEDFTECAKLAAQNGAGEST